MSGADRLTDAELVEFLGLDSVGELISTAKVHDPTFDGSALDTMFIQTCAGAWVCLNSPGSRWEFHQDEEWE